MSEKDLIQKCIKRDRKAQYFFYKKYFQFFYSVCYRYTRSREKSLEVMNLGFAKVMLNLKKYDSNQPLDKWMKTIVINTVIDEFRKTKRYDESMYPVPQADLMYLANNEPLHNEFEGLTEEVEEKLDDMNPVTKDVFKLYTFDGFKHKEIANMLGIPEGTCHYHYSVAKKSLREFLTAKYDFKQSI